MDPSRLNDPIRESFVTAYCSPEQLDVLLSGGWRHFGPIFFRYSLLHDQCGTFHVAPLRIDLEKFRPSKGQRRTLRKNADLSWRLSTPVIDGSRYSLFEAHHSRFVENRQESLEFFLGTGVSGKIPCEVRELTVNDPSGRLLAASYISIGKNAYSSIYAMFDPLESRRRLGITSLLWEIEAARLAGCRWLYHGYAYREASHYDYKKAFQGLEWHDWVKWLPGEPPPLSRE